MSLLERANGSAAEELAELRRERTAREIGRRAAVIAGLEAVSENGVVDPNDSIRIHTGEHPVVKLPQQS